MSIFEGNQTPVKFCDLSHAVKADFQEYIRAASRVLESGWYILGSEVAAFEQEFSQFVGTNNAVGVANGTDAVELGLRALGVGTGDVVITVSHTAVATVAAIERAGAIPAFVDIDPNTFTMSVDSLEEFLSIQPDSSRVKAVVPVHLYGHMVDMEALLTIAQKYGLGVVEDCAQAHGASLGNKCAGSIGDFGAFSFYPTKNLGGFGDGGAVTVNDKDLYNRLLRLRQYGWEKKFVSEESGINSRLDELQAAFLRIGLARLAENNRKRRSIASRYNETLTEVEGIDSPWTSSGAGHVYHLYVVKCGQREKLADHLTRFGVESAIHYPLPVHRQPAYLQKNVLQPEGGLPVTEEICGQILSLPLYPELPDSAVDQVCSALRSWRED